MLLLVGLMDVLSLDIISLDLVTHITHKHTQIPLSFPLFLFWDPYNYTQEQEPHHRYPFDFLSLLYTHKMAASCHLSLVCVSKDILDKQDEWTEYIMADPFGWKIERELQ